MNNEHTAPTITDHPLDQRFEARIGAELAGTAVYKRRDGVVVFTHTEVDDAFAGRGVGGALAKAALDAAEEHGDRIVPLCPFIASYIERHPQYEDLVDHEMLDRLTRG